MAAVKPAPVAPEAQDSVHAALDTLERHAARLAATGDPVTSAVAACAAAVRASVQLLVEMKAQPVADIERTARAALIGLRPAFERRWRWQRWAALVGAFTAGCAVNGLTNLATWKIATVVAWHDAGVQVAQWQSWWNATCADQSPRRVIVGGKPVCQVPVEQTGGNR